LRRAASGGFIVYYFSLDPSQHGSDRVGNLAGADQTRAKPAPGLDGAERQSKFL
jgi:hypothetical protein